MELHPSIFPCLSFVDRAPATTKYFLFHFLRRSSSSHELQPQPNISPFLRRSSSNHQLQPPSPATAKYFPFPSSIQLQPQPEISIRNPQSAPYGKVASMNQLTGMIPNELCELQLESLNLYENRLEGTLPESIARSKNLYELKLFNNKLRGGLPSELGKYSPLQTSDLSYNQFSGEIPEDLCEKGSLEDLVLIYNSFSGKTVPYLVQAFAFA